MNYIQYYNNKYKTLDSIMNIDGNLNAAITRRSEFKHTQLYKDVVNQTSCLNVFDGIKFVHRVAFIHGKMKIEYCPKCNKPYIIFPKSQKIFSKCKHTKVAKVSMKYIANENIEKRNVEFCNLLKDKSLLLSTNEFNKKLEEISKKKDNYNFSISKYFMYFFHDCVIKTLDIIQFDQNDYRLNERVYLIKNNMNDIPSCKYCGKQLIYKNKKIGYGFSCTECQSFKSNETRHNKIEEFLKEKISNRYEIVHIPTTLNSGEVYIKCKKCGKTSKWQMINGFLKTVDNNKLLCKFCEIPKSKPEEEMYEFVTSICNDPVIHKKDSRKIIYPQELDIYVPSKNLAIEFDGLYWHSEAANVDKKYHLSKTVKCEAKGIQLVHVFEDEWQFKKEIVKSRLKNLLGMYDKTIYARKCEVKQIDNKTSKLFQEENHLQGAINSKVNLGLFFKNELISLMSFGKCRFEKKHEWEMLRFCSKLNYHIVGGAGKLLKFFEKNYNPKSLVSYADRRWSQGKLYKALGFKLDHISSPNYFYISKDFNMRHDRVKFQKHRLNKLLAVFDNSKTEVQNMKDNGYSRIFDCGNLVFVKEY